MSNEFADLLTVARARDEGNVTTAREELILLASDPLQELAERLAERENFAQIVGVKVRAGVFGVRTPAANLNNARCLVAGENRSANHFLDELRTFSANFDALKNRGVANAGEIVADVRSAFAPGLRGDRGGAKWKETNLLERLRD